MSSDIVVLETLPASAAAGLRPCRPVTCEDTCYITCTGITNPP
ncbi:hypothetical protein [Microbispora sp. H11081]|nr:hypothetical protein [Microbispora sp. H11081]